MPMKPANRVAIDKIIPDVDNGRFAAKSVINQATRIAVDIVCDGHEVLTCSLHIRAPHRDSWTAIPLTNKGNDRWQAFFTPDRLGMWEYTVSAGVDRFQTWLRDLNRHSDSGGDLRGELAEGQRLVESVLANAPASAVRQLRQIQGSLSGPEGYTAACSPQLASLMKLYENRSKDTWLDTPRRMIVERKQAAFSAWYEAFPRSWGIAGNHGTLRDLADSTDYIAAMGFDVLYLPPIHPIGKSFRKGKNNSERAEPDDVGSPWGIGSIEGGHCDIHPDLGTLADFEYLQQTTAEKGMEVALDLALQCSPDHPWVVEHPEWFCHRVDGTIRYAENPPKKYQDIYPLNFETNAWQELWRAIRNIVEVWITRGVKIFRVDNPHTKPFDFWEWLLADVRQAHPDVLFLAEAFTRPKTMYRLAKLGFSQSYTYFTWRTEKQELSNYLEEVTTPPIKDFFRPNFFTNTPDILHATLQSGGRPMFMVRLALAALSVGNWGIYGPAMELQEATPREPGSEEYLDSEKYEIKQWDREASHTLAPLITRLNEIRKSESDLCKNGSLRIQTIDNPFLLAWSRHHPSTDNHLLIIVNLKPNTSRSARVQLDPVNFGMRPSSRLDVTDLLTGKWSSRSLEELSVECTPDQPVVVLRLSTNLHEASQQQ